MTEKSQAGTSVHRSLIGTFGTSFLTPFLIYISVCRNLPQPYMKETDSQMPPAFPQVQQGELVDFAGSVLRALEFTDGSFHVELKYTSNGPRQSVTGPDTGVPDWLGEITVCGDTVEAANQAMDEILRQIELPIEPDMKH